MKKLIQISLVVILLFVLFQTAAGGAMVSGKIDSNVAQNFASTASGTTQNVQMAACLVYIKGVICVKPNVGWNS